MCLHVGYDILTLHGYSNLLGVLEFLCLQHILVIVKSLQFMTL